MREIFNISVPPKMAKQINKDIKERNFASKSEFFRHLIRLWEDEKLYQDVMESEKDFAEGRYYQVDSLADLIDKK